MIKDRVFQEKPKPTVIPPYPRYTPPDFSPFGADLLSDGDWRPGSVNSEQKQQAFTKDSINLERDYHRLNIGDILQEGDIFFNGKTYLTTITPGVRVTYSSVFCYWRKKSKKSDPRDPLLFKIKKDKNLAPLIDLSQHRKLEPGETVQSGDEYYKNGEWHRVRAWGGPALIHVYRRRQNIR